MVEAHHATEEGLVVDHNSEGAGTTAAGVVADTVAAGPGSGNTGLEAAAAVRHYSNAGLGPGPGCTPLRQSSPAKSRRKLVMFVAKREGMERGQRRSINWNLVPRRH